MRWPGPIPPPIGGGVATLRAYLAARLVDEVHLAFSPVFLGAGENVFVGMDLPKLGYERAEHVATAHATHLGLKRR